MTQEVGPNRLYQLSVVLTAAYLLISGVSLFLCLTSGADRLLLASLALGSLFYVWALATGRQRAQLLSWPWLGMNLLAGQTAFAGADYPAVIASSLLVLSLADLSHFLRLVWPTESGVGARDSLRHERAWSLVKEHFLRASLLVALAGLLATIEVGIVSPVVIAANPILGVGLISSLTVFVVFALAFVKRPESPKA